jgi:Holliday junction resolvase RusA-like endonuclease
MNDKQSIALNLPLPPTANHMWQHQTGRMKVSKTGKRFSAPVTLSETYKAWLDKAGWIVRQQIPGIPADGLIQGRFSVRIEYPLALRGDEDGFDKPIFDLLQRMNVIRNDRGIFGREIGRTDRADVLIVLTDLGGAPFALSKKRRTWSKPRPKRLSAQQIAHARKITKGLLPF